MPTNKKIVSLIIGSLILFIWNAISWMVLPFHGQSLKSIPEEAIQASTMQQHMPEDGIYHYPGLYGADSPEGIAKIQEKLEQGPRITMMVYKSGSTSFFDPTNFVYSLALNFLSVFILLIMVTALKDHSSRNILKHCLLLGLLIGLVSDFSQMNWYQFPFSYTVFNVIDYIVGLGFCGLFFARYAFKVKQA
jgi:hypothetical protein